MQKCLSMSRKRVHSPLNVCVRIYNSCAHIFAWIFMKIGGQLLSYELKLKLSLRSELELRRYFPFLEPYMIQRLKHQGFLTLWDTLVLQSMQSVSILRRGRDVQDQFLHVETETETQCIQSQFLILRMRLLTFVSNFETKTETLLFSLV